MKSLNFMLIVLSNDFVVKDEDRGVESVNY